MERKYSEVCKLKPGPENDLVIKDLDNLKHMMDKDWPVLVSGAVLGKAAELKRNLGR
jgi:hypothetical protein